MFKRADAWRGGQRRDEMKQVSRSEKQNWKVWYTVGAETIWTWVCTLETARLKITQFGLFG